MANRLLERAGVMTWGSSSNFNDSPNQVPSLKALILQGGINSSTIGATNHGNTDANIAQRNEVTRNIENLLKGGGDKVTYTQRKGQDGKTILDPYVDQDTGDLVYPNQEGYVRNINGEYLDTWEDINEQIENKIDEAMKYCIISDELAKFVLGIPDARWKFIVSADFGKNANKADYEKMGMSQKMAELDCSIKYIKSLPANSMHQTQSLSKLRQIVREHLANVNIKRLVSKEKMKSDMKDGRLKESETAKANIASVPVVTE